MTDQSYALTSVMQIQDGFEMITHHRPKFRRRWSSKLVTDSIGELENRSAKFNQTKNPGLYGAAIRYFGSWKTAVEATGFDYQDVAKRKVPGYWQKDKIVEEIKKLEEKSSGFVRKFRRGLYSAALRLFCSWESAVRAAGFNYSEIRKDWIPIDAQHLRYKKRNAAPQK